MVIIASATAQQAHGQGWDTTGNNLLQGTYYFRQVAWFIGDNSGTLGQATAVFGTMNFDGNGKYTLTSQLYDSGAGTLSNNSTAGTYSISASGYGFISSPIPTTTPGSVYGLVSRGIFVGSSTEAGYNDLFIAAQLASPAPTNGSFQGAYTLVDVDFPTGIPTDTRDLQLQLNSAGNGTIGTVQATGYIGGRGATPVTQNVSGVRYLFSNGGANVSFGGTLSNTNLIAGTKYLYFSADGNFVFGGSPTAWDMIVGIRSPSTSPAFNGLYYQAGITQDESQLASGFADLNTFYGSLKANAGVILGQQRLLSVFNNNPYDFTYADSYQLKSDGSYDDLNHHYLFGAGGAIRIGFGKNPSIGINVAVQAPAFNASGVFIDPTGVVNAASFSLFTSGLAPGELISIFGANLASSALVDGTFPFLLGGVQVMINNRPAPIYVVSPGRISAVVPFATTELTASIQVINNGTPSNTVTEFVNLTAPGVFTIPNDGISTAAALHANNSLVSSSNPAQAGETVSVFVTGLGAVTPGVADGAPGPSNPLSNTSNTIAVYIGGKTATTTFAGLAPQFVGLYQINVQIPTGVASGNALLEVTGPDFDTLQATIPIQ